MTTPTTGWTKDTAAKLVNAYAKGETPFKE
jgi:hypothetical protein